jgi:uncharacterized protein (DUF433 family)
MLVLATGWRYEAADMLRFEATPCPVVLGADGVIRVRGTAVELELLVGAFDAGATPGQISHHCPSLSLASIHAVIGYVLTQREGVDRYLRQRADVSRAVNAARPQPKFAPCVVAAVRVEERTAYTSEGTPVAQ